ncbi:uncharacterized protein CTRU02_201068 [Colletotrichum truncatum]|uniref:Uncharacterized protein n=1 Tax=Colletotrichum truncatum TaxID=5467 RepID=A0ACC3ZGD3_COLTU|nr:uncharacterized protein CTRU02_12380 [Colletotrichum truncatum]KAF6784675.1 hypothetical protein CTRU02_12380 [Colletotrichum truncatum]
MADYKEAIAQTADARTNPREQPPANDYHKSPNGHDFIALDGQTTTSNHSTDAIGTMAKFPPTFRGKDTRRKLFPSTYYFDLSPPDEENSRSFSISYKDSGSILRWFSSGFEFQLHDGPYSSGRMLATVTGKLRVAYGFSGNLVTVTLPPVDGLPEYQQTLESKDNHIDGTFKTIAFHVDVNGITETFEWRRSRGNETRHANSCKAGFKLVQTTSFKPDAGGKRKVRDFGSSSDGGEILAVVTNNKTKSIFRYSESQFRISFMGRGLTGALGERWEVMVAVTGHLVWLADVISSQLGMAFFPLLLV